MNNLSKLEKEIFIEHSFPLTILRDRYGGTYSHGRFLAFPYEYTMLDPNICADDINCAIFWRDYKGFVGKGNSPQEAYENLYRQIQQDTEI